MHEIQKLTLITTEVTGLLRDSKIKYVKPDIYRLIDIIRRKTDKVININEVDLNKIIKEEMFNFAYSKGDFNDSEEGDDR